MNLYISEAAIPQIVAIRYCAIVFYFMCVSTIGYLGCVLQYAVLLHPPVNQTLSALLSFFHIIYYLSQSTAKLPWKHGPKRRTGYG